VSRWTDIFAGLSDSGRSRIFEGVIAEDAPNVDTMIEVAVTAFDRDLVWGPCAWMPRIAPTSPTEQTILLPAKGDRCVVALAETEDPGEPEVWILGYWPS
jgi:hypothetical protein